GELDGALEPGLAGLRAVGAAEKSAGEALGAPAGALGAGAGRKMRHRRPHGGHCNRHGLSFQIGAPRWGGVSRVWDYWRIAAPSSGSIAAAAGFFVNRI